MKLVLIILGFLFLAYIAVKVLPLKLRYANIFFALSLIFHIFAAFTWSYGFIIFSFVLIIIFFLVLLYLFGL
ncbi:hypothetical protein [Fervidobacterium pennivorans]|uniref:hypothetical protein n=1 Tax=Fervidobacterium pennivorans TaxID=93466 RepID=UPI0014367C03|nr:hypothetical protein [Fervidobacterium pennivorans]QIV77681.1 hypothetical protein HER11_00785 [Fervidobacterium pennivorans subsp. keratinolyticus]